MFTSDARWLANVWQLSPREWYQEAAFKIQRGACSLSFSPTAEREPVRELKQQVWFNWLQSNLESPGRSGEVTEVLIEHNTRTSLFTCQIVNRDWILGFISPVLVALNRVYLHRVLFQLETCFLPSIESTSLPIEAIRKRAQKLVGVGGGGGGDWWEMIYYLKNLQG